MTNTPHNLDNYRGCEMQHIIKTLELRLRDGQNRNCGSPANREAIFSEPLRDFEIILAFEALNRERFLLFRGELPRKKFGRPCFRGCDECTT